MSIRAVFFDMGGTIETYNYTKEMRLHATQGIQEHLQAAGIHLPLSNEQLFEVVTSGLNRYHQWRMQTLEELPTQRIWSEYILAAYPLEAAALESVAEDLTFYIETNFYRRQMRPEIPAVLAAIQQMGLKIGLISNVSSLGQVPFCLKQYGLQDYFEPIILSSAYGRRKPDPAIFHHAARLANVPTSACLYVGDRISRDIDGARRAGYGKAILIRHDFDHGENDAGAQPDAVIENLSELLDILHSAQDDPHPPALPGKVRALIFDAGDILYYRPERGAKFIAFLQELGLELSPNHAQQKKAIEYQAYRGQISHDEYRAAIVRMYGITQAEQVERGKQALIADDANVAFFDGVPETLLALKKQGYLLGIITDTANPISAKLSWFERGGFGHVWDVIISSLEIGARKPDPALYHAALLQLGVNAGQALFIGHRTSELAGAHAVGMPTVAFNYDREASADFYIEKFADLLKVPVLTTL